MDRAVCVKTFNNFIYIAGTTYSSNFPTIAGAYKLNYTSGSDIFVSKFNSSTDTLVASTFLGGSDIDYCSSMDIDKQGNIFLTGWTSSTNFPVTNGTYKSSSAGAQDCFVSKFNSNLSSLMASTYIGGSGYDYANSIKLDKDDNPIITGYTMSTNYPVDSSAVQKVIRGTQDAFISKFNSNLNSLTFSTYLGGSSLDYAYTLTVDTNSNVYIAGSTQSTDFPLVKRFIFNFERQ